MLFWVIQQIVISLVIIMLIHYIYKFLQDNLTTPKIKDLVTISKEKYKDIYDTIESEKNKQVDNASMKNELQSYLKELSAKQKNNSKNTIENVSTGTTFLSKFTNNYETV